MKGFLGRREEKAGGRGSIRVTFILLCHLVKGSLGKTFVLLQMPPVLQGNTALFLAHRSKEMRKFVFTEVVPKLPQNSSGPCPE